MQEEVTGDEPFIGITLFLSPTPGFKNNVTAAQWLRTSNIFRQLCQSTSEWRGFESRWFLSVGI